MERLDPTFKIDEEALTSMLLRGRTTRVVFSIPMTAEQALVYLRAAYRAEVIYRGGDFVESDDITEELSQTADFLTSEDFKKNSLVICGRCGNGKTTLARSIQTTFFRLDLRDEDGSRKVVKLCTAKGIVDMASKDLELFRNICDTPLLAIDDLGNEPVEQMNYGNVSTPVIDLIEYRYEHQLPLIITTNLTPAQIGKRYNERVADRITEMARVIIFTQESYRHKTA